MSWLLRKEDLIESVKGQVLRDGVGNFFGVSIDSRKILKKDLFFAIKGKIFDGHNFLSQALDKGATGFVIDNEDKIQNFLNDIPKTVTVIKVKDTLKSLQDLSVFWRDDLNIKVLAVTGSNGKTTTKSFARVLMSSFFACSNPKSYNNHLGVPLSLLSVSKKDSFLIQEIGSNASGEIAFLSSLCKPFVSAITMVGDSHLEGFGSIDKIAEEKKQIYVKNPLASWIFNRDNFYTEKMFQEISPSSKKVISFSKKRKDVDVHLYFIKETPESSEVAGFIGGVSSKSSVSFSGLHNLDNLMCACGLALSSGVDPREIWKQIPACQLPKGRQTWFHLKNQKSTILFDSYNSNPVSLKIFLKTCELTHFNKMAFVLGDMKELGEDSKKYHEEIAAHPILLKSSFLWFIGDYGKNFEQVLVDKGFKGQIFKSDKYDKKYLNILQEILKSSCLLGIKASRSLALEELFFDLTGIKVLE